MEWERAKNYLIIAFILLNLGLGALIFREDSRFTLTSDRIGSIHAVLSDNNINFSYTTPMRRFAPMRHLDISGFYYDISELIQIFFENEQITFTEEGERHYIIESESGAVLEISNGFISFDKRAYLSESAEASISDFVQDIVFEDSGGVHIIYLQEYRGQLIDSNFIEFFITADGISWIDMQYGRVIGHSAEPRMIFAPDEILLTFMQRVRHEAALNPIFISNIDIVYKQEYASDRIGAVYPAVPFYRIFVRGRDFPFYINAYTNIIIQ
jgi:hypothetical protein